VRAQARDVGSGPGCRAPSGQARGCRPRSRLPVRRGSRRPRCARPPRRGRAGDEGRRWAARRRSVRTPGSAAAEPPPRCAPVPDGPSAASGPSGSGDRHMPGGPRPETRPLAPCRRQDAPRDRGPPARRRQPLDAVSNQRRHLRQVRAHRVMPPTPGRWGSRSSPGRDRRRSRRGGPRSRVRNTIRGGSGADPGHAPAPEALARARAGQTTTSSLT
jgi:hypothetical protein